MIKKYLYLLLALPLVVLSFQSCIKDDSYGPSGNSSKLSLAQDLQEKYTLNRWDTLKITPNVVQTNEQKKVDYEWEGYVMAITHTVVAPAHQGKGIAKC